MAELLSAADLDYMRAAQAEARPTGAWLQRYATVRGTGGNTSRVTQGDPIPLAVRVWDPPDEVPQVLAERYEGATMAKVHADMVLDVREGDRFLVGPRTYEVVSDGVQDAWTTSQGVWTQRLDRPARAA